jgi:hypothetical protein
VPAPDASLARFAAIPAATIVGVMPPATDARAMPSATIPSSHAMSSRRSVVEIVP